MSLPYGPPVAVSPVIRGTRFILLFAGIIYGLSKKRLYGALECQNRQEAAKRKVIRDKELAILRKKIAAEEQENVRLFEQGKLF